MIPWRAFSGGSLQTLASLSLSFFFFCWVGAQAETGNWWLGMLERLEGCEGWEGRNDAGGTWRKTWARKRNISQGFKNLCLLFCAWFNTVSISPTNLQCELLIQLALLLDFGQNLYIRLKTENWSSLWESHNLWMTSGVKAYLPVPSLPGRPPW